MKMITIFLKSFLILVLTFQFFSCWIYTFEESHAVTGGVFIRPNTEEEVSSQSFESLALKDLVRSLNSGSSELRFPGDTVSDFHPLYPIALATNNPLEQTFPNNGFWYSIGMSKEVWYQTNLVSYSMMNAFGQGIPVPGPIQFNINVIDKDGRSVKEQSSYQALAFGPFEYIGGYQANGGANAATITNMVYQNGILYVAYRDVWSSAVKRYRSNGAEKLTYTGEFKIDIGGLSASNSDVWLKHYTYGTDVWIRISGGYPEILKNETNLPDGTAEAYTNYDKGSAIGIGLTSPISGGILGISGKTLIYLEKDLFNKKLNARSSMTIPSQAVAMATNGNKAALVLEDGRIQLISVTFSQDLELKGEYIPKGRPFLSLGPNGILPLAISENMIYVSPNGTSIEAYKLNEHKTLIKQENVETGARKLHISAYAGDGLIVTTKIFSKPEIQELWIHDANGDWGPTNFTAQDGMAIRYLKNNVIYLTGTGEDTKGRIYTATLEDQHPKEAIDLEKNALSLGTSRKILDWQDFNEDQVIALLEGEHEDQSIVTLSLTSQQTLISPIFHYKKEGNGPQQWRAGGGYLLNEQENRVWIQSSGQEVVDRLFSKGKSWTISRYLGKASNGLIIKIQELPFDRVNEQKLEERVALLNENSLTLYDIPASDVWGYRLIT